MQVVFSEVAHLIGSSGGVESTAENKRKTRVNLKAMFDIIVKLKNGMVQGFELVSFYNLWVSINYQVFEAVFS